MSYISISYNGNKIFVNPNWMHEIMYLIVRELESDSTIIEKYNLYSVTEDYKVYYSVPGDVFENPTSFDEIFEHTPSLHEVFSSILEKIRNKLMTDENYCTFEDLTKNVDIGLVYSSNEVDIEGLIEKIIDVETLLKK